MVYDGPAAGVAQYFASLGHPCPQFYNPAEFLADLISVDTSSREAELESRCGPPPRRPARRALLDPARLSFVIWHPKRIPALSQAGKIGFRLHRDSGF